MNNRSTGRRGEEIALEYLLRKGFLLLERNYTSPEGEIDLILKDGDCLVFVEVKMRRGEEFGEPVEAVGRRKQETIRRVAGRYLAEKEPEFEEARFDVLGILLRKGSCKVRHVEAAF